MATPIEQFCRDSRAESDEIVASARPGSHDEILDAVRSTGLQYAWDYRWHRYTLPRDAYVTVHGRYRQRTVRLPAGTVGWHHVARECVYTGFVYAGDVEQYPADGAVPVSITRYHAWSCLVEFDGETVLAEKFEAGPAD